MLAWASFLENPPISVMRRANRVCALPNRHILTSPRNLPGHEITVPVAGVHRRVSVEAKVATGWTRMNLFAFEQTKSVYWADFIFYGAMIALLAGVLAVVVPDPQWALVLFLATMGLVAWSAIEYAVHRFVLHGMQPFRRWHAAHHARPAALICSPTTVTASIIGTGLFLPVWAIAGLECACASTIGLLCGYLAYAFTHHAIHHWHAQSGWLRRRKRWHVLHHHESQRCCYGVTSGFWDAVCGTRRVRARLPKSAASRPH